jgi:hypothetical protein
MLCLKANVARVCFEDFRCLIGMLQVFHMGVPKVDPNVLSVFQTYVTSVFIWMLHMFHTIVVNVLFGCCICLSMNFQAFSVVFASVSDACFKCFKHMFQVFICLHTYVTNVLSRCSKNRSSIAVEDPPIAAGVRAGKVVGGVSGLMWGQEARATFGWRGPSRGGRPGASTVFFLKRHLDFLSSNKCVINNISNN